MLFGSFVARVQIGVKLTRQLAISLLDLIVRGAALNAKHVVIVFAFRHDKRIRRACRMSTTDVFQFLAAPRGRYCRGGTPWPPQLSVMRAVGAATECRPYKMALQCMPDANLAG